MLKTKDGVKVFSDVAVEMILKTAELSSESGEIFAYQNGVKVGRVISEKVMAGDKKVSIDKLVNEITGAELVGKNPIDMTTEEIAIYTEYLQELAAQKTEQPKKKAKAETEETPAKKEKKAPKPEHTVAELQAMSAKDLWKNVIQPIADTIGVNSRAKKDEMIEAYAKYFGLEIEAEEEEETPAPKKEKKAEKKKPAPVEEDDEDEDDEDDEEEDESEDEEDDDEDESEDSDDEDDEDDEDEDDDSDDDSDDEDEDEPAPKKKPALKSKSKEVDEDEEDDEKPTAADIDALGSKEEILAVVTKYGIKLPKEKLTVAKVKAFIKNALGLVDDEDEDEEDED